MRPLRPIRSCAMVGRAQVHSLPLVVHMLDLPVVDALRESASILLLGAGGGYDVLGSVPLFVVLRSQGKKVFLGGVSFSRLAGLPGATPDPQHPCLYPMRPESSTTAAYCPEAWLARWLTAKQEYVEPVWAIAKTGVRPLRAALGYLATVLELDTVVLIDGGVDLILKGDETSIGTPSEDLASLQALQGVPGLRRFIMCLGFGAELRDGIAHAQVLERVAEIERAGGYLGAISLMRDSVAGRAYLDALAFLRAGQEHQRGSHIHQVVSSAMQGRFGHDGADVWHSPLASLCWFFRFEPIADSHLFARHLEETDTIWDVSAAVRACRRDLSIRERSDIPL
jgi:hypothetical protein